MSPIKHKKWLLYILDIVSFNVHGITSVLKSLWNIFILNGVYQLKKEIRTFILEYAILKVSTVMQRQSIVYQVLLHN